jgi:soluble lytic murein transglycosylase-like protein
MVLDFINHHPGTKIQGRLSDSPEVRPNRTQPPARTEFMDLLSAFQRQPTKITFKTKGLTIVDYRARPVISKSRCRFKLAAAAAESQNWVANHFPKYQRSPTVQKDISRCRSLSAKKNNPVDSNEKPEAKADSPGMDLPEQQIIKQKVREAAEKYNLRPELINAVIRAESNFEVQAVSSAGAQGLMQLMPATAKELGVNNPFDIEQNIDGGAKYLRMMLDRFGGNVRHALAAYNAGPGTVSKYGGRVPYPETHQYVQRVLQFSKQIT